MNLQDNIGTLNPTEDDMINEEELRDDNLNFRSGYAGRAVFDLLPLAQRDTEMLKKLEENRQNQVNTTTVLDIIKQLTAGKLYQMGKIVLGIECLFHVKSILYTKKDKVNATLHAHKASFLNARSKIDDITKKYNKKYKAHTIRPVGAWIYLVYASPNRSS